MLLVLVALCLLLAMKTRAMINVLAEEQMKY